MREIIVTDNGREKPMFIITTDFEHSLKDIIDLYPPRCLINAAFLDGWVDGGKYVSWLGKKLEFVWM